jgi:hypothetical protein
VSATTAERVSGIRIVCLSVGYFRAWCADTGAFAEFERSTAESLIRVMVDASVGPFAQGGLNEALGLSVPIRI